VTVDFDVYARCFNEILAGEGWEDTSDNIIKEWYDKNIQAHIAARMFIEEEEEFQR
jgi:hypothetical protein